MSFRTRLILTYALVVVVCLGIIAVAVSVLLQSYRDRITMTYLANLTRPVYIQVRILLASEAPLADVYTGLQEQAADSGFFISLVNDRGTVVWQASPNADTQPARLEIPPGQLPSRATRYRQGIFETPSGREFIFTAQHFGRPVNITERRTFNTVVLAAPRGQPITLLLSLARPFFYTGLTAFAVSIIIALWLARSLYRPVQRVTRAAERMAQGQYDQEIKIAGPKEVRQLAASFNKMSQQVTLAQDRLRHFVADVSHQLKSPLTSIQGFAQAITDGTAGDEETRKKSAGIIQEESRKMMRQVDELLELSRMQSGQVPLAREPVNLEELLKQCREIFSLRMEEKNMKCTMDIPLLPVITGDADRLEQVFNNLLDNAIKNSLPGGEIQITARKTAESVEIRVADTGPGVPPDQLPYVFERFYQAIGVRTGVGLGLAIAREIILGHGGDIRVISNPGEKTEFIIELPVAYQP